MTARIGIIGCGNISGVYFRNLARFRSTRVVAAADLDIERARSKAAEFDVPRVLSVPELLADPEVDIVLNLTVPRAHAEVTKAALNAGKHVYSEKPLGISVAEGEEIMAAARERNLRVGCAPDTFLGSGIQTCLKLIRDGVLGEIVGATAFMLCHGHESWHPDPEFYYEPGGGPMLDMGPYYLTALCALMGPIDAVAGFTRISFPQRIITSQPKHGKQIDVQVSTHVSGNMQLKSGVIASILTTFDVWHSTLPRIELYGSEGTLLVPDPNGFGGPVRLRLKGDAEWREAPLSHPFAENSRGIGVADMAAAIEEGRPHRASGGLALHVLHAMEGFEVSSASHRYYESFPAYPQPEPLSTSEDL